MVAFVTVPAAPDELRDSMGKLIDAIEEKAGEDGVVLDWGALAVQTVRAVDGDTGAEYIRFGMWVRGLMLDVPES
jgi:hypothetical protein